MKYYFVARTPTSVFVSQYNIADIKLMHQKGGIKEDYFITKYFGPSYSEIIKLKDIKLFSFL